MAVSEKTTLRHNRWKRQILDIIRRVPNASRIVVKRMTGLSMDSSLALVDALLQEGLIVATGKKDNRRAGRKATILKIHGDGCYFIGIRFNASRIAGVCINFERNVVCTCESELSGGLDAKDIVQRVGDCIDELLEQLGERRTRLLGIGIGAPGIIDLSRGIITRYVHIPGWESIPLRELIQERFETPTYLEHGVKCTARAVMAMPEHASSDTLLFLQMGRGINMCVVVNGRILSGANYLSGEVGHMHVEGNECACECGRTGCLETLAASGAICNAARRSLLMEGHGFSILQQLLDSGHPLTLQTICTAADRGCKGCNKLLEQAGQAVGCMLASSIMIINPQEVILSGHLCTSQTFCTVVRETLTLRCMTESLAAAALTFMPADAQLDALGAAELPFQKEFGVEETGDPVQKALQASL